MGTVKHKVRQLTSCAHIHGAGHEAWSAQQGRGGGAGAGADGAYTADWQSQLGAVPKRTDAKVRTLL